jgi:hypothetical protein
MWVDGADGGLAGGSHAGWRLTQERTTNKWLRDVQGPRWLELYSAPFCCLSEVQVGPVSLLKAAEGCLTLTVKFLMVVRCQTFRTVQVPVCNYLGFYIYYTVVSVIQSLILN